MRIENLLPFQGYTEDALCLSEAICRKIKHPGLFLEKIEDLNPSYPGQEFHSRELETKTIPWVWIL
jgi:hypothetical protein